MSSYNEPLSAERTSKVQNYLNLQLLFNHSGLQLDDLSTTQSYLVTMIIKHKETRIMDPELRLKLGLRLVILILKVF